jgi:pimeloyl-ACP methyl ester carboxylesterase
MRKLFLPGYGASGRLYERGLSAGWRALEPPPFHATGGAFRAYEEWLGAELRRSDEQAWLAGHSMGGALAVAVAVAQPTRVARLTLISPAGLPLRKPVRASLAQFGRQVALGRYELREVAHDLRRVLRAPRAAYRLAQAVRVLDLTAQMRRLRELGLPAEVVACSSDTLVTPLHCRRTAELLGGEYRELDLAGGHMWMLDSWPQLARLL